MCVFFFCVFNLLFIRVFMFFFFYLIKFFFVCVELSRRCLRAKELMLQIALCTRQMWGFEIQFMGAWEQSQLCSSKFKCCKQSSMQWGMRSWNTNLNNLISSPLLIFLCSHLELFPLLRRHRRRHLLLFRSHPPPTPPLYPLLLTLPLKISHILVKLFHLKSNNK